MQLSLLDNQITFSQDSQYPICLNRIQVDKNKSLEEIPIVKYFVEIFLEDLIGLPADKEIEFAIDLVLEPTQSPRHLTEWLQRN